MNSTTSSTIGLGLASAADVISTSAVFAIGGVESNPVTRAILDLGGMGLLVVAKAALIALVWVTLKAGGRGATAVWVAAIALACASVWNVSLAASI